jgi:hypothetical protein
MALLKLSIGKEVTKMTYGNSLTHTAGRPLVGLCLLVALFSWSHPAAAAPPSEKLLRKVAIGSEIHVVTNDGQVLEGKVVANSPSALSVLETGADKPVRVDPRSVASVGKTAASARPKRSWLAPAIGLGAIVVGVAVAASHGGFLM